MIGSTPLFVATLGLIWSTWQISRRALSKQDKSKRHEELTTFINYLVGWAVLVGLILSVSQIPAPINQYLVAAVSVVFTIVMVWVYLGERISKHVRIPPRPQRIRILYVSNLILAFVIEPLALYLFYQGAYLLGSYDELVAMAEALGILRPDLLFKIHIALIMGLIGVVEGMFSIAVAMYSRGFLQGLDFAR